MEATRQTPLITEHLCESFAFAADALSRRRAAEIQEDAVDKFVALGWMDWHAGSLRVTALGQMALARIRNRLVEAAA